MRLDRLLAQRERRVTTAVVELDPLTDPVRAADPRIITFLYRLRISFIFDLIRRIEIRREGFKLTRAGINPFEDGANTGGMTPFAHVALVAVGQVSDAAIRESALLGELNLSVVKFGERPSSYLSLQVRELRDLVEKPGIDMGQAVDLVKRPADIQRMYYIMKAILVGGRQGVDKLLARHFAGAKRLDRLE